MNRLIISRSFEPEEYWLFARGGACPQNGWVNDETGEPVDPPDPDEIVEWETEYGYNTPMKEVEGWPVKVMSI